MPRQEEGFFYGVRESQLLPRDVQEEETPLRFVSVKLEIPSSAGSLDIDLHAFLFEADGTYVDCVFYKNPTLAGKSIKLIPSDHELRFDLCFVPERCKFIVCTVAVYSGGCILDLKGARALLSAIVPSSESRDYHFPEIKRGLFPTDSSLYTEVRLGVLPIIPPNGDLTASGLLLCMLSHHEGFWYFKPVVYPVAAFTPQGLIEPAQRFVLKFGVEDSDNEVIPDGAQSMNSLLRNALEGEENNLVDKLQVVRLEGEKEGEKTFGEEESKGSAAVPESEEETTTGGLEVHQGQHVRRGSKEATVPREPPGGAPSATPRETLGKGGKARREVTEEPLFDVGEDEKREEVKSETVRREQLTREPDLFSSLPPEEGFRVVPSKADFEPEQLRAQQVPISQAWCDSVERRLDRLERIVEGLRLNVANLGSATREMQSNNKIYIEELRGRFLELKADVAADIEKVCGESFDGLSKRIGVLEINEAEDAKQLAALGDQIAGLDKLVVRSNRDTQLVAQSLSELKHQISGLDGRVALFSQGGGAKLPLNARNQELPIALELTQATQPLRTKDRLQPPPGKGTAAIAELENLEKHTEAFGESLRRLASGAAPDGLKGLSEIERKVLSFAGTPKVFDALHELEKAVDEMKLHACGVRQQELH